MSLTRPGGEVKYFPSAGKVQDDLAAALSPERLSTYLRAVREDREKALRLYTWNTAMSAAFYGPLQGLEVALRNAMHRQLDRCYGARWYDNPAARFDMGCRGRIAAAKEEVVRDGHSVTPCRVLATLSFGFWIALLGSGGRVDSTGRQGGLRNDALEAGPARGVSLPHPPHAEAGPWSAERSAETAESNRPSRTDLRAAPEPGLRNYPGGDGVGFAGDARVDRALQPCFDLAPRVARRGGGSILTLTASPSTRRASATGWPRANGRAARPPAEPRAVTAPPSASPRAAGSRPAAPRITRAG